MVSWDLPGYGYAKRSKSVQDQLQRMISSYILQRQQLVNVFVLIDIRHDPQKIDRGAVLDWLGVSIAFLSVIVFTKADKLADPSRLVRMQSAGWKASEIHGKRCLPYFITSSEKKTGRQEVIDYIGQINDSLAATD